MTIKLKNYRNQIREYEVDIPSDIIVVYTIQAGDEVVYIFDSQKNLLYTLDSCESVRTFDLLDKIKLISREDLIELNKEN